MTLLSHFRKDTSGSFGMMFGLLLVPLLAMAGAAVDYARASAARSVLDAAVDSTALLLAREAARLSDSELSTRASAFLRANLAANPDTVLASHSIVVDRKGRTVNVTAATTIDTSMIKIVGIDTVPISSSAQSSWGMNTIELALVLDNTGSMASSGKMTALKQASLDLLGIMKDASTETGQIKVSVVPFATQVRVSTSYADAPWLRFDLQRKSGGKTETITRATWTGCVSDRDKPYDIIDDGVVTGGTATLYPADFCTYTSLATLRPLSNDWSALTATVNAMTPVGNTNVTIGVSWGLATLTQGTPLTEAASASTPRLTKYMIVLTDGDNTRNRFNDGQSTMDSRTASACQKAKDAGIKVYTIRVINGDRDLLRNCASSTDMYYEVTNASQLRPIFQSIAQEISQVRLTM